MGMGDEGQPRRRQAGIAERVGAVIVTHNSAAVLADCLRALPSGVPVVVVDNASSDGSIPVAQAERPDARVMASRANLGFGCGANLGIDALATSEFVLLINPDARLAPGALERLVAAADRWPDAAMLGPEIRRPDGAVEPSHDVMVLHRQLYPDRDAEPAPEGDTCAEFLSGAALLLRRAVVQAAGGFDPALFLFYEDDDLCLRLRRAGHVLVLVPEAVAVHASGSSSTAGRQVSARRWWHMGWSRVAFERKHCGRAAALRSGLSLLFRYGAKAALYAVTGRRDKRVRDAARFSGTLAALLGRPATAGPR